MKKTAVRLVLFMWAVCWVTELWADAGEKSLTPHYWEICVSASKVGSFRNTTQSDLTAYELTRLDEFRQPLESMGKKELDFLIDASAQIQMVINLTTTLGEVTEGTEADREKVVREHLKANGEESLVMMRCLFALYNAKDHHEGIAEEAAVAELVAKGRKEAGDQIVFKGLHLGMPIKDAVQILSFYCQRPLEIVNKNGVSFVPVHNSAGLVAPNAAPDSIYNLILCRTDENSDRVSEIRIPGYLSDVMFQSSGQDARTFARNFVESYKIPHIGEESVKLRNDVTGIETGTQTVFVYRTQDYELRIYDVPEFDGFGDATVPSERSVSIMSTVAQKENFD
jgi:hypothetical protein